jgi:hypothetical protein
MQVNIFKKIRLLALLSLPFLITTSAFAQSLPTVSVNPNPVNIVDAPIVRPGTATSSENKSVEMEVTNTSQEELTLFAAPIVEVSRTITTSTFVRPIVPLPNSNQGANRLKPGAKGRVTIFCNPLLVGDLTGAVEIRGVTSTNANLRAFATIPVKCNGVASKDSARFSLKLSKAGINDVVDIQVKSGGSIVKQLKCQANPGNNKPSVSGCDLQVAKGVQIEVITKSSDFARFINSTGSAKCQAKVCTFRLDEDSSVTASFKPTVSFPPVKK